MSGSQPEDTGSSPVGGTGSPCIISHVSAPTSITSRFARSFSFPKKDNLIERRRFQENCRNALGRFHGFAGLLRVGSSTSDFVSVFPQRQIDFKLKELCWIVTVTVQFRTFFEEQSTAKM